MEKGISILGVMKSVCVSVCVRMCVRKAEADRHSEREETVAVRDFERCDCSLN